MDEYLRSLNHTRDRHFDRNRRDYNGTVQRKTGRYQQNERRNRHYNKSGHSHLGNKFPQQDVLFDIRKLLKEIITAQKQTLTLLNAQNDVDQRIAVALEIIAANTQ